MAGSDSRQKFNLNINFYVYNKREVILNEKFSVFRY